MTTDLKVIARQALLDDKKRHGEHQETCGLRLTNEQMSYLTNQNKLLGIGRGAYMRRLLIIDMVRRGVIR